VRHRGIRLGHLFRLLDRVSGALGGAVAHRDHQAELLARGDLKGGLDLAVRHGDPAGVETQLLGPQYDLLPVVPAGFLQVRGLLSDQRDVVFYAGELPVVGRKPSESSGLIQN
ncbi:Helix-turn-helix transcriptional regulator, partial [Dysosmobacter welbionis]